MNVTAHTDPPLNDRPDIKPRTWAWIFFIAFIARAGWGIYRWHTSGDGQALEFPDEQQYWRMARSLTAGDGLADEFGFRATRMPFYPALLSLFTLLPAPILAAKILHWIAGSGVAVLTALLAGRMFDRRVAFMAGMWVALDPFLIFFSSLLLTETFFLAALLCLWLAALRPLFRPRQTDWMAWLWVGLGGALGVHVRESGIGLVVLLLITLLTFQRFSRPAWSGVILAGLVVAASLLPWAARNHQVTGNWTWLTNRGGISLYDGVGPQADGSSNLAEVQQMPAVRNLTEVEWDRFFRRESFRAMREDPARIVRLAGVKLARMWNPVPNVETYRSPIIRLGAAVWTIPTFALAVVGVMLLPKNNEGKGWRLLVFLLLPAAFLSVLHCFFVGSIRYRLPAMPMLEILAAFAMVTILGRIVGVKHGEGSTRLAKSS